MWSYLKQFFFVVKPTNTTSSLTDLPDHLIENIFKYLDLKKQMELASMNEHFNKIIHNFWLNRECFLEFGSHWRHEELWFMLQQLHEYLSKIKIYKFSREQWKIVKHYTYPNVKELSITFREKRSYYCGIVDEICVLFPNLKSLHLLSTTNLYDGDIKYLIQMKSLEDLSVCGEFTFNRFQKLFEVLRLKSLSVSGIRGPFQWTSKKAFENFCALERFHTVKNWNMVLPHILEFSNLKKISGFAISGRDMEFKKVFHDIDSNITKIVMGVELPLFCMLNLLFAIPDRDIEFKKVFHDIVKYKCPNITKIVMGAQLPLFYLLRHTFPKLTRLEILFQNMNQLDVDLMFKCAPNLREIVFYVCYNLREQHIKKILHSNQIEFFYISWCDCKFNTLSIDVDSIVEGRRKPLSFHFVGIPEERKCLCLRPFVRCDFYGKSPLFKLLDYRYQYSVIDNYSFEFQ